jgi:hypothetical protein
MMCPLKVTPGRDMMVLPGWGRREKQKRRKPKEKGDCQNTGILRERKICHARLADWAGYDWG